METEDKKDLQQVIKMNLRTKYEKVCAEIEQLNDEAFELEKQIAIEEANKGK